MTNVNWNRITCSLGVWKSCKPFGYRSINDVSRFSGIPFWMNFSIWSTSTRRTLSICDWFYVFTCFLSHFANFLKMLLVLWFPLCSTSLLLLHSHFTNMNCVTTLIQGSHRLLYRVNIYACLYTTMYFISSFRSLFWLLWILKWSIALVLQTSKGEI